MDRSLEGIRGIGPARLRALNEAGLYTVRDLARFLPKDYRDLTAPVPLCELRPGEAAAVRVYVGEAFAGVGAPQADGTVRFRAMLLRA